MSVMCDVIWWEMKIMQACVFSFQMKRTPSISLSLHMRFCLSLKVIFIFLTYAFKLVIFLKNSWFTDVYFRWDSLKGERTLSSVWLCPTWAHHTLHLQHRRTRTVIHLPTDEWTLPPRRPWALTVQLTNKLNKMVKLSQCLGFFLIIIRILHLHREIVFVIVAPPRIEM